MFEISPHIYTALIGVLSGFIVSIPVGPINVTIINEGAQRGFRWAFLIGLGAVCMDLIYCVTAFAGFSGLFTTRLLRGSIELLSFLAMLFLGLKYLRAQEMPKSNKTLERVEHRLDPHTAFMTGFVRVLGNPAMLLLWITLSATFLSHEWIDDSWNSKLVCIAGIGVGALIWFLLLSFLVSLGHGRFSTRTLLRMSHVSGACLLLAAAFIAYRLVRLLAERGPLNPS
jgi:threonine/homoserine/homoserine lactone efflux protein